MDVFDAIAQRRSYRGGFKPDPVTQEDLVRIVQAGLHAPSGCNAQTPRFVIVTDPAKIKAIGQIHDRQVIQEAKAIIVCIADHRPVYKGMSFGVEDCAAAVENMLLVITALGYATVWIDGALRAEGRAEAIARLLQIPEQLEVRIILPVGRPSDAVPAPAKLPFEQRAWFNGYGATS